MTTALPRPLTAALRNLGHFVHMNAWGQWRSRGLSATQRRILELLAPNPERNSVSAIARELGASVATASDSVAALESKGLVSREPRPSDARSMEVLLTSAGRECLAELAMLDDPLDTAVRSLSRSEQAVYHELTLKLLEGLRPAETSEKRSGVNAPANRASSKASERPGKEKPHAQGDSVRA